MLGHQTICTWGRDAASLPRPSLYSTWGQGCIEPSGAVRGHATLVDGKMLSVTKINMEFKFRLYKHEIRDP